MKKTICCFGHREIFGYEDETEGVVGLKNNLSVILAKEISENNAEIFLTGRRGEFDNLFAGVVRDLKKQYPHIKLILVEPYFSNKLNAYKDYYNEIYDTIIIPDEIANVHYKNAITLRNRWMVENSDCIIAYVNRRTGGAYKAMKYAKTLNKLVLNLGDLWEENN